MLGTAHDSEQTHWAAFALAQTADRERGHSGRGADWVFPAAGSCCLSSGSGGHCAAVTPDSAAVSNVTMRINSFWFLDLRAPTEFSSLITGGSWFQRPTGSGKVRMGHFLVLQLHLMIRADEKGVLLQKTLACATWITLFGLISCTYCNEQLINQDRILLVCFNCVNVGHYYIWYREGRLKAPICENARTWYQKRIKTLALEAVIGVQ